MQVPTLSRRPVPEHGPWPAEVPAFLQRIYASRGVLCPLDAELKLARLLPPADLGQIDAAVLLLASAIATRQHIVIVGDFDCDGATGTAVAVRGLRLLGATRVSFQVPHRVTHGYGLSPALVEELVALEPDLIVTVDNGIACHEGVAAAKGHGWLVLITDHHLPGQQLPVADVIVNPNLQGDGFGSKSLAGVGVVFYLLLALRRHLREANTFAPGAEPDLAVLLDLVAVGTVADLVALDFNNRLLVAAGLRRIQQGKCQPGVRALAEVAGRPLEKFSAADIGFGIAPRINAAGRLEDMALGIECLLCDDLDRARELAAVLDQINSDRRGRQKQMVGEADLLVGSHTEANPLLPALIVYDGSWHPGVVGLVASKLKDRVNRPVIAFAPADESGVLLRGSARSIPGFHMRDALAEVDAMNPGLIDRFGGHAMAAGLTLRSDRLDAFRSIFSHLALERIAPELLLSQLLTDGELLDGEFTRASADALRLAGPWGQGFPEPLFDNIFVVREWRVLGERHLKFSLQPVVGGPPVSAIHFGGYTGEPPPARLRAVYQLELDDFRSRNDVQLLIRHWQEA